MTSGPAGPAGPAIPVSSTGAVDRAWRKYVRAVREAAGGEDRMIVMAAVLRALARVTGWSVPLDLELGAIDAAASAAGGRVAAIDPPEALADPWLPGRVHEALLGLDERQASGAHYTSRQVASELVGWAASADVGGELLVCDPAAGGGAFLLAAAELLFARGGLPDEIVERSLWGIEVDPVAVAVTSAALSHWAWRAGRTERAITPGSHVVCADALLDGASAWAATQRVPRFDLVVGNPPFQNQLGRKTARTPHETAVMRSRLGDAVTGYADNSALFLLAACGLVRPGGRVALIEPTSIFGARDATGVRAEVLARARLDGVWIAGTRVFGANVRVGAIVLEVDDGKPGPHDDVMHVRRATGPTFAALPDLRLGRSELRAAPSWSHLITASGTPPVDAACTGGRLGDVASATAGFRDQYYGLIPFVAEGAAADPPRPGTARLVTSGLIDPARCRWGRSPGRFNGRMWVRPTVDVASARDADPRLGAWLERVLVPKVLVACQTRVVEAIVDEAGVLVPSVPVIAVCAERTRLYDVASVLLAPWTSAWAVHRAAGAALGADAIKLAAKQVLDVPLPADTDAWSEGAEHLRLAPGGLGDPATFAAIMNRAYGVEPDGELTAWWLARLPVRP